MLLLERFSVSYDCHEINHTNFLDCNNVVEYLNNLHILNTLQLKQYVDCLKHPFLKEKEINLLFVHLCNVDTIGRRLNQIDLAEFIVEFFFPQGIDLMQASQAEYFYVIANDYFEGMFSSPSR